MLNVTTNVLYLVMLKYILFHCISHHFDAISNTLELSDKVLLGETKLNHVNTNAKGIYSFTKKINI